MSLQDLQEEYVLICDGIVASFSKVSFEWKILRDLMLQLCSDSFPDFQRIFHLV